jgi:nitrate reductase NapA
MALVAAGGILAELAGCGPRQAGDGSGDDGSGDGLSGGNTTKAVCRFCGTGCGVICESEDGKLVATYGDPDNPSSKGMNCIKGLWLSRILYGDDRLTTPLVRDDRSTKGTAGGLREASWDEALDLVADRLKTAWRNDKKRIAFWGSGQQPITEGYCTAKFWKAGLLSNNIDPNARLCMASAVVAFMNVFQTDEPAGSYQDLDLADVFVTWGANMAEAHPVLYSRLTARKVSGSDVRHYDITTMHTRTAESADKVLVFRPGSDLAIANAIANYLIQNDLYDKEFVEAHVQFKEGAEDIGNSLEDGYDASDEGKRVNDVTGIDFARFAERLAPYTLEYAAEISGVPAADIEELARLFGDPEKRIVSLWTMGVNQHNRGTWMNHCIYNVHLLAGKIAKPGSGPFSLTGQPSACGTAREVGTFAHRLPADLVVNNEQHRRYSEAIWDLPEGYLDEIKDPGFHTVRIFKEMSKGNIDFLWTAANNWAASMPNLTRYLGRGSENRGIFDTFIVVNEVYPTLSTQYADVVFPCAMWVEREGQFGNAERRTAIFEKAVDPPGEARWELWTLMQVARRVLDGSTIGTEPAFNRLFGFIWDEGSDDLDGDDREINRRIWNEYRLFSNPAEKDAAAAIDDDAAQRFGSEKDGVYTPSKLKMEAKQLAPYDEYLDNAALTDRKSTRLNSSHLNVSRMPSSA